MAVSLEFDTFSVRDHERVTLTDQRPTFGRWIAVMARSCEMPEGPQCPTRTSDGAPVEQAAILCAMFQHAKQQWQWQQLSPPTKEFIGDLLFEARAEKDRWYYVKIEDLSLSEPDCQDKEANRGWRDD